MAISPQPAKKATSRGPKSRAGFQPPWVSGASILMSSATVRPMNTGARYFTGRLLLRRSTRAKIISTRMPVPRPSTAAAPSGDTRARAASSTPVMPGLGKYSPNIMVESWLPGSPRSSPCCSSNRRMKEPYSIRTVKPASTAPSICEIQ